MPPNNPPLASVRARSMSQDEWHAETAEQFGKDFRAEQESNFGCGGVIECCFPMDGNCACFNAVLGRAINTATTQLLDEIEGRVKGLKRPEIDGLSEQALARFNRNSHINECLTAIQEVRHGRS